MGTATDAGFTEMRVVKAVAIGLPGEDVSQYVVLEEASGARQLVISIGGAEAFSLAASLQGMDWGLPMTYQFMTALVDALGGRVRQVRLDRVVDGAYAATVEVEGPLGTRLVDARCSDALNLAVLTGAQVAASPELLADFESRREQDSQEAAHMRLVICAEPMTIRRAEP